EDSIPDAPLSYQDAVAETSTDSFTTATSDVANTHYILERFTHDLNILKDKIKSLEKV
ncbi:10910_t:CDS:2, partial [Dentiscutata erythropus]